MGGGLRDGILSQRAFVGDVLDEQVAHLEHVEDPVSVAPHGSTTSARTRRETPRAESPLSDDVDVSLKELLEVHEQATEIHQAATGLEVD